MKDKMASEPDGIPGAEYKLLFYNWPNLLLGPFNASLKEGIFPTYWKVKGTKLDTARKVLKKFSNIRLPEAISAAGDLFSRQFGFREWRSSVDALMEVVDTVHQA